MSLILDALKRAERERRGEAGPVPGEVSAPAAGAPPPRRGRRLVPFALVVVTALALCALLLWDAFRATPAPDPPPAATAQPPQPQPQAPPVIVARPAPPEPAVVPGTEGVASLDDLTDEPVLEAPGAPPEPEPAPKAAQPKPQKPTTIATTPAPPPTAAEIRSAETRPVEPPPAAPDPAPQGPPAAAASPAPQAGVEEPPPAQIPPALTQPAPLRKLREMPPDYRADFPALRVEIHVYEKAPQRRFVMVNGRRYREGERLAEGPSLVEIVPEGMVLEHRGEKVLYTLGR